MRIRRFALAGVAIALLAVLVSGCGGSGASAGWAKLDSGKPAFYYFGAPS